MNVTINKTNAVEARLTVEVVENDYKEKVEKDLRKIGRTHQIPGFRKGHIGLGELYRRFGRDITSDVINREVHEAVMKYIQENNLQVLGYPVPVEVKTLDFKTQKEFTFEYDLALTPEIDVVLDKSETLPCYEIEVTDKMIDEQSNALRRRYGQQGPGEATTPESVIKGAIAELNADGTVKVGEGAIEVPAGIVSPEHFVSKDQAALFADKKVGDEVVFNPWEACGGNIVELASMLNADRAAVAGMHSDFRFTISEIINVTPAEMNQEFFDMVFGQDKVHDDEEYRQAVKSMIAAELQGNSEQLFRAEAHEYFMKKYGDMQLPEATLKRWLKLQNEALTDEQVDAEWTNMLPSLKWEIIEGYLSRKTGINVTEADVLDMAKIYARSKFAEMGMANMPDDVIAKYAENIVADKKNSRSLYERCHEFMLFKKIQESVTLDQKTVSVDGFRSIVENLGK